MYCQQFEFVCFAANFDWCLRSLHPECMLGVVARKSCIVGSARASRVSAYWCPHRFLRSQLLLKVGARPTKNWMQKVWVLGEVSLSIYVDLRATIT